MTEKDDIRKEAEEVLSQLSSALGDVSLEETYYVVDEINVTRGDSKPRTDPKFIKKLRENAIHMDGDGNFIMEMGKWVK
jgi:predicted Asp-tRNA(Asn)/Glu-tRNA(Gln) amidotransferase subunit C